MIVFVFLLFISILTSCLNTPSKWDNTEDLTSKKYIQDSEQKIDQNALDQIDKLISEGNLVEARKRFREDDITELSTGSEALEYQLRRGQLYIKQWDSDMLGLLGGDISSVISDGDDLWAGTWTGGLVRMSVPLDTVTVWDPGKVTLAVRTVNRIIREQDRIYVVRYGGIDVYDIVKSEWSSMEGLPVQTRIQDIGLYNKNLYIASLGGGLWKLSNRRWNRIEAPGLQITEFGQSQDNSLIVCTLDSGLFLFDSTNNLWIRPSDQWLRNANVTSALRVGSIIYGGTYGEGAFAWNLDSDRITKFNMEGLSSGWIMDVTIAGDWLYFATFGHGIIALNQEKGRTDSVSVAEGLPTPDVSSLSVSNDGSVWGGTLGGGLIRLESGIHGD